MKRVSSGDCETALAGMYLDGAKVESYGGEACKSHYAPEPGCFFNGEKVYATAQGCDSAVGRSHHHAVCEPDLANQPWADQP